MSKKNESFEALRDSLIIRKKLTGVLRVLFLQSQKKLESLEASLTSPKNDDEITELKENIRIENFNLWLIKEECRTVAVKGAELSLSLIHI